MGKRKSTKVEELEQRVLSLEALMSSLVGEVNMLNSKINNQHEINFQRRGS